MEAAAFEPLVRRHQDTLFAFALNLCGDRAEAEDIAQETLIRAWRAWRGYPAARQAELRERPWLFRIATNVFRNRLRSRRDAGELVEGSAAAPKAWEPEVVSLRNDRRAALRRHLQALPAAYREAVVLRHVHDLPYEEAAAVLGVPVGTVKSNCHRGLRRLEERLGPLTEVI